MILLQIYFDVSTEKAQDFEQMYRASYVPALKKQEGYLGSTLLRLFPPDVAAEIEAAATTFNYQMELMFDTEAHRRRWVASEEHSVVWPLAEALSQKIACRGQMAKIRRYFNKLCLFPTTATQLMTNFSPLRLACFTFRQIVYEF